MVFRLSSALLLGSLLCGAAPQQPPPADPKGLADASIEELMNIEVTSVSKKSQRLSSTAASVFVINAEDIRRSGITVLPELLRLAPGVQVARVASGSWAIAIRGFNDAYSNKLLVLIDGRSVYNEFYSGVFWDALNISVDDIERIEVIRGPGAAMWGTNAVNGVINIITKSAKTTQGGLIVAGGGSEGNSTGSVRYGTEFGGAYLRVGAENVTVDTFQILNGASPSRGSVNRGGDLRMDWDFSSKDSLEISAGAYTSSLGLIVPSATATAPNAPSADDHINTQGENIVARWQHVISEGDTIDVHFSYEHMLRKDPQDSANFHVADYGFQQHLQAGSRNDLIWGFTYRDDDFSSTGTPALSFSPSAATRDAAAVFAEDEIALVPDKLSVIFGVQVSKTATLGYAVQPTGRLLWTPTKTLSSWIAVSRAMREPSLEERGINFLQQPILIPSGSPYVPSLLGIPNVLGNPASRSETALTYEAGQRVQASRTISFDVSTFYTSYQHLATFTTGSPVLQFASGVPYLNIPVTSGNDRFGDGYGAEFSAIWNVSSRWKLNGGYTWLRVETSPYRGNTSTDEISVLADPHHQWLLRSNFDLTRTIQIDTALYYYGGMREVGIPQHLRGDLRIGWRPAPKIEFSIGVQDAFEANHVEGTDTRFGQTSQVPRNFYGRFVWKF
jgi:iron complex outermembrane receptor protein